MAGTKIIGVSLTNILITLCFLYLINISLAFNNQALVEHLDAFFQQQQNDPTGLAVGVFRSGKIIYERYRGYSDKSDNRFVNEETVFEWGSITKVLTWVSVMQLKEEGKLDLEQDIRELLPEDFFKKLTYDQRITLIHLMNHTGGWKDENMGLINSQQFNGLKNALQQTEPEQIMPPGRQSVYCNWSTALAGYIVEQISGMSFAEYVHQKIFNPLQIKQSALLPDLSDNPWVQNQRKKIKTYDFQGDALEGPQFSTSLYPAGMTTGTLKDLLTFAVALNDLEDSPLFKDSETLQEFFSPTLADKESGFPRICHGLWCFLYNLPAMGHMGSTKGFTSLLLFDPYQAYGTVILTNKQWENTFIEGIAQIVFGENE